MKHGITANISFYCLEKAITIQILVIDMDFLSKISKQEAISLLALISRLSGCKTFHEISDTLTYLAQLLGFEYAVYGIARLNDNGSIASHRVVNISYPKEWLSLYDQRKFYFIDPISKENFSNFGVQCWQDTYKRLGRPKEFVSLAEDFGLKAGYVLAQRDLDFWPVCDKPSRTEESPCERNVTTTPPRRRFLSSSVT